MMTVAPTKRAPKRPAPNTDANAIVPVATPGFLIPSNADAEQAILGSLMIDPDAAFVVFPLVRLDDFYFEKNRWIFEAMLKIAARKDPIDFLTVVSQLEDDAKLIDVGGAAYITSLINAVPTAIHAPVYAKTVHEIALRRKLIHVSTEIAEMGYEGGAPIEELIAKANTLVAELSMGFLSHQSFSMADIMTNALDRVEAASANPKDVWGITTGFDTDRVTGGLHRKQLFVLSGDPGIGKTSFVLDMAVNAAQADSRLRQVFFSLEMSMEELGIRWVSNRAQVNSQTLKRGRGTSDDLARVAQQAGMLSELAIRVFDMPMDAATIAAMVAREKHQRGVDLVWVDYSKLVLGRPGEFQENEALRLGGIAAALKNMAKQLDVSVVLIHPVSRNAALQNRQPVLADLGWSVDVGYHADVVAFLWKMAGEPLNQFRLRTRWDESSPFTPIQAIIAKGRNGPTIPIDLMFDGATTRWLNPTYR
jgi:replicative DNA helicase